MVDLVNAHRRMSDIIMTYLYRAEFTKQVSKQAIPEVSASLAMDKIIWSTAHTLNDSNKLAMKLLRKKTPLKFNIAKPLANAWNPWSTFERNDFLHNYAKTFWASHLASSLPLSSQITPLFQRLCDENVLLPIESDDVKQLFQRAVVTGSVELAAHLINACNANVNWKLDSNRRTALHLSVMHNFGNLTELLLNSENIDVGAMDVAYATPMRLAAKKGFPLIYLAAKCGQRSIIAQLIKQSQEERNHLVTMWNTIERAALEVRPEMIQLLLDEDVVQQEHAEITKCLLESQRVPPQTVYGHESSRSSHLEALSRTVSPNAATLLHIAARLGWVWAMPLANAIGDIDFNKLDSHGLTPLLLAAKFGQKHVVRVLIHIPNVNLRVTDPYGNTAVQLALQYGHRDIVTLLSGSLRS
jgi:ankyrin repeat protein